jgi:hypothetical protein
MGAGESSQAGGVPARIDPMVAFRCEWLSAHYPDFLLSLVALANFMRLSLPKAAHEAAGECRVAGNPVKRRSNPC